MFKMFAVLCILVYPEDNMVGMMECKIYYEDDNRIYSQLTDCETAAEVKAKTTIDGLVAFNAPFESIEVGCEKIED